jgi:UDP-N-acetylglucosamine acyltransferase
MNKIHPTAIIDSDVLIGTGNVIGPYAVILGNVCIGNDNWIGPHVTIGTPAQMRNGPHPATWGGDPPVGSIHIGHNNIIREFTTVHSGTVIETTIGNNCYFMTQSHVPHDAQIQDDVTLSNSVQIGGHTIIQQGANIGLGAVIHQRLIVGMRAMIGMGSVVTKSIPPFAMAYGSPANVRGGNTLGMHRVGFNDLILAKTVVALKNSDMEALRKLIPAEMEVFDIAEVAQRHA